MSSSWSKDDLHLLDAAYVQRIPLSTTAYLLRKAESEVRQKAIELGYIESPPIAPKQQKEEGDTSGRRQRHRHRNAHS